jgi:hypothetical protein
MEMWLILFILAVNLKGLRDLRKMGNSPEIYRRNYADLISRSFAGSVEFVPIDNITKVSL